MKRLPSVALGLGFLASFMLFGSPAGAQQQTFHLDRLEMPGAPQDGVVMFRPATHGKAILFAQLGYGISFAPLRTRNITTDSSTIMDSNAAAIRHQFTQYATVGVQFLDRFTVAASLPATYFQDGQNPNYSRSPLSTLNTTTFDPSGPTLGDTRLDLRGMIVRSEDRRSALGAQLSLYLPTGNVSKDNFGGDGQTAVMLMITGEHSVGPVTLVANTGVHFRPDRSINDPLQGDGLGVGDEWRWAVGAFLPFHRGRYRLGLSIFGQTGIENSSNRIGNTIFTQQNSPIEWNAEGRMRLGAAGFLDDVWIGASVGTLILPGYGAPNFRGVMLIGTYLPLFDSSSTTSPDAKAIRRAAWRDDDMQEPEQDGAPASVDRCPDGSERRAVSDSDDGCGVGDAPTVRDTDNDGIVDTLDACPKEPGQPSPDPSKNGCPQFIRMEGSTIRILEQVHFKTGSATILPESFPMLQEIANLLTANKDIHRVSIEGHTDNRGPAYINMQLSQGRAESVVNWLVEHKVEANRLEAHGFGLTKPLEDNATEAGRATNRRVEFKIIERAK